MNLSDFLLKIQPLDTTTIPDTQAKLDNLTKPKGSLGRLEELALHVATITGSYNPPMDSRRVFVMAGDSGVVAQGVSAYPQEVTPQMVYNFLGGGAGINALSKVSGFDITIVDVGIATDIETEHPGFVNKKVGYGTKDFSLGAAMSREDAEKSIVAGIEAVLEQHAKTPLHLTATGDMGIGNTTPSSAIIAAVTGARIADVTGYGTGLDEQGLERKIEIIQGALELHAPAPTDPLGILSSVGSFEIGGIAGVVLASAYLHIPVIVDGFISQAGALIASLLNPYARDYIIPSHQSVEKGSRVVWGHLGLRPYLSLDLRLGEGTGAVLMGPMIDASMSMLNNMASFAEAGVSGKNDDS
jgi:nicotinate-nucleotide--dimethylbenzimidazole phosphoribosyltransferase